MSEKAKLDDIFSEDDEEYGSQDQVHEDLEEEEDYDEVVHVLECKRI